MEEGTSCEKPPVDQNQEGKIEPKIEQNIEQGASNKKQKDIRSFLQEVNEESGKPLRRTAEES